MSLMRKISVKNLGNGDDLKARIEKLLSEDKENAYTVQGIMIDEFRIKESDIHNKSFSQRLKEHNALYARVRWTLNKLVKEGKLKSQRKSRADFYYWVK